MNNSEKRNSKFDEYDEYESEMTSERNAHARADSEVLKESRPNRQFGSSAEYEKYIGKKPERKMSDDLIPSGTTMQFVGKDRKYVYEDMNDLDEKDAGIVGKEGLSGKNKIMIAVYAIVVLTIFTLIIMNTRLLKTMDTSISEQEARISELVVENNTLAQRYKFVSSDEEIIRRAEDLGMVYKD